MKNPTDKLENLKVNTRIKLAGLWITLMMLYIYCDIYSFHRPGYIDEMIAGFMGPFEAGQEVLAAFSLLMIIPALMIPACLFLKARITKLVNILVAVLYTVVNIGNLAGEAWVYYWIYGILEIVITAFIIIVASKWPKEI